MDLSPVLACGLAVLCTAPVGTDAPLPPLAGVIRTVNDLYRAGSSGARMTMTVVTARFTRELELRSWTRGKKEALVAVLAPAREAGMATLRTDEGLWSYAPRADRLVRIPTSLLADGWMGSHFTNDDLIRETDFTSDYDAALAWSEDGGRRVLQVTLVPKPGAPVVWSRVVYLLDPLDDLPLRAEYRDGDRVARTLTFSDPHEVHGRRIPFTLLMVPADQPGEYTRIHYEQLDLDVPVDPGLFSQRGLRRVAER